MRIGRCHRSAISSAASFFVLGMAAGHAVAQVAQVSGVEQAPPAEAEVVQKVYVTAQRQFQLLQDVPMAVTALTASDLASRQINNALDLQYSVPNLTFTKAQFDGATFTIRGVGELCTGLSCDPATAIHINDMPVLQSRIFETEFFDLQRIEVLRGPQGTLYGRNATAGVINFITARPTFDKKHGSIQVEAGSYDTRRVTGMLNVPFNDTVGLRLAGTYLKRNGYTRNLFDNSRIDGRDLYALRTTLRIMAGKSTTLDVIGSWFREDDNRTRFTKQLCARDEVGIMGCRADRLGTDTPNFHGIVAGALVSRELFAIASGGNPMIAGLGLSSVYGPDPVYGGVPSPADVREVSSDMQPSYRADNAHLILRLEQKLGDRYALTITGGYVRDQSDQRTDFNLAAANPLTANPGLLNFAALAGAPGSGFPGGVNPFTPAAQALFPNGLAGGVCTSEPNRQYTGVYGGHVSVCSPRGAEFERWRDKTRQRMVEAHVDSKFDGPLNFLVGAIYLDSRRDNDYFVNLFALDYSAAVLGGLTTLGQRAAGNLAYPNVFLGPGFYDSELPELTLESYGVFGEAYYDVSKKLKLTGGLRYSSDEKRQHQRAVLLSFPVPFGIPDAFESPYTSAYDADASLEGSQLYAHQRTKSSAVTGRFVADYRPDKDTLYFASYSRGYKAGGINPATPVEFQASSDFKKETLDAFELGARNTLLGGKLSLSTSAFAVRYNDLQISRLVARSAVNDNADADIHGAELESVLIPVRGFRVNLSASFLKTKLKELSIIDPRDPSGGRTDVVVIKDIANGSNCAVIPAAGGSDAGANELVAAVNAQLGLRAPVPLPGTSAAGAFSICDALRAAGGSQYTVANGVEVNLAGNELPLSPRFKLSSGAEYTFNLGDGMLLVPRIDAHFTGRTFSSAFNKPHDRLKGYANVNAQVQLSGPEKQWFVRTYVQNLTGNDATTGRFISTQAAGTSTNIFVLEPRRYGVVVGGQL
ncbi:TonB-dependent receptor [Massilia cavernae]|uniref:TonB-dependent receptor n=1 Tax=Massilia cavernae TaxID=2320864 RepID=A0A418XG89_9BURK|nr:TonB-dependent receptor [Massilia cavernae]RJG11475.1 TonB-dependent receptor [Massilia cavernae]